MFTGSKGFGFTVSCWTSFIERVPYDEFWGLPMQERKNNMKKNMEHDIVTVFTLRFIPLTLEPQNILNPKQ